MGRDQQQPVLFENLYEKPVVVEFTRPQQTSDGGVILLDAMDKKMGLPVAIPSATTRIVWPMTRG
jgi:hypothetical protein